MANDRNKNPILAIYPAKSSILTKKNTVFLNGGGGKGLNNVRVSTIIEKAGTSFVSVLNLSELNGQVGKHGSVRSCGRRND